MIQTVNSDVVRFVIDVDRKTLRTNLQTRGSGPCNKTCHAACVYLLRAVIEKMGLDEEEFLEGVLSDVRGKTAEIEET